jgi:hypothetical protein
MYRIDRPFRAIKFSTLLGIRRNSKKDGTSAAAPAAATEATVPSVGGGGGGVGSVDKPRKPPVSPQSGDLKFGNLGYS